MEEQRPRAGSDADPSPFLIKAPEVTLPKGGGAIQGIGEKFTANPVTGTGSLSVPIACSPGRGGFGPQLALSYDSGAGNGPFGLGWSLSLPSIARKTEKGLPRYLDTDDSDTFILAGAEDLVRVLDAAGQPLPDRTVTVRGLDYQVRRYRPRVEGSFAWIERWSRAGHATETFWRTISRDNGTTWYGRTADSRVRDPADPARIFQWLICQVHDDKGNVAAYTYQREDGAGVDRTQVSEAARTPQAVQGNTYIKRIRYGNIEPFMPALEQAGNGWVEPEPDPDGWMFEVVFDYGDHPGESPAREPTRPWLVRRDAFSSHRAGFEVRTYRLCRRVLMFHHFPAWLTRQRRPNVQIAAAPEIGRHALVRSTDLEYAEPVELRDPATASYSTLKSVTQRSYQRREPTDASYECRELPPVSFTYSTVKVDPAVHGIAADQLPNLPVGTHGPGCQWVDLDGEGLSGVLVEQGDAWYYKANRGEGRFAPLREVARMPSMAALSSGRQQLMDLTGGGEIDLVDFSGPAPGFHEHDRDQGWKRHVPFAALPNIDWNDPQLRFVDLTGDGHADALITEHEVLTWYPSLARRGFGAGRSCRCAADEDAGPRLVFGDPVQSIFLADLCGDGLTALVRIRNGDICYWPNLGYGRFGRKVVLANAPRFDHPDLYDPQRIRLADIDGSGTIDLIYLGRSGAQLYFNRSGNSWSDAFHVPLPLATENLAGVQVADLLGNGTACLVWSSHLPADVLQPVRYIDLMGRAEASPAGAAGEAEPHGKPHLLVAVDNNRGGRTEIEYTPSTHFYLQDLAAGTPWVTRLPFPVHCVSRVTVRDRWRGTSFSTRYSYHHGCYDGDEREFRGFGRVEQVDVEHYGIFAADNAGSPWINGDHTLFQPPVQTITWYHTGSAPDRHHVLAPFAHEYFPQRFAARWPQGPGTFNEHVLPEPELPAGLDAAGWREAARACKGMALRQEVFELDVDDLAANPPRRTPLRLFSVTTRNGRIQCLQGRAGNAHGVFLVTESESVIYHHELSLHGEGVLDPDPRISHTINLRHDEHGNLLQAVTIGYGRWQRGRYAGLPRQDLIEQVQAEEHLACTEHRYTGDVLLPAPDLASRAALRHHRLRLPCEAITCELKGITRGTRRYFSPADFLDLDLSRFHGHQPGQPVPGTAVAIKEYHEFADGSAPQRRIVQHMRTCYFDDGADDAAPAVPLPFGEHGPRGLKYEDYQLALTDALLAAVFGPPDQAPPPEGRLDWEIEPGVSARSRLAGAAGGYVAGTAIDPALAGQYWMRSGIAGFADDANGHFFLPERFTDAFGATTRLTYDPRDLFVQASEDARHNIARVARFDHRVLAPAEMVDIHGNHAEVAFDIHGLVVALAAKGKQAAGQWQGDHLDGWTFDQINPPTTDVAAFCTGRGFEAPQEDQVRRWLGSATTRFIHHFGEARDAAGNPTWQQRMAGACAIARETHAGRLQAPVVSRLQLTLECTDGSGAVLMKKLQAEPDPAGTAQPPARRWLVNGLTVLNNKGKPVRHYEPAFSADFGCEMPAANGVSATLFYDAPGRLVRTDFPDGTHSRVEFSPWHVKAFDQNDTVLESLWIQTRNALDPAAALPVRADGLIDTDPQQRAGWLARQFAGTPAQTLLDSLGREVIAIEHNRVPDATGTLTYDGRPWKDEYQLTFKRLDAEGKPLWVRDARSHVVMQYILPHKPVRWSDDPDEDLPARSDPATGRVVHSAPAYDIAGNLLHQHSMDAGSRWMLADAAGRTLAGWDFNESQADDGGVVEEHRLQITDYDELHRPVRLRQRTWSRPKGSGQPFAATAPVVLERFEYQDAQVADDSNLNGQPVVHVDAGGLTRLVRRSFTGAVEEMRRQLPRDPTVASLDWTAGLAAADPRLEAEVYIRIAEHDALGRLTRLYNWHRDDTPGTSGRVAVQEYEYNERGVQRAQRLHVRASKTTDAQGRVRFTADASRTRQVIQSVSYNARGQPLVLELGNQTVTRYVYDERNFQLIHLHTRRGADFAGDCPGAPSAARPCGVQNLHYVHDAAGHVTHIRDDAQQRVFFNGGVAEPGNDYTYDALYRLTAATGRENAALSGAPEHREGPWPRGPIASDRTLRRYTQRYTYDSVGNFVRMQHIAQALPGLPNGSWTRDYDHAFADAAQLASNRLSQTWEGGDRGGAVTYGHDVHGNLANLPGASAALGLHWDHRDMLRHVTLGGGSEAWYQYDNGKRRVRKHIRYQPAAGAPDRTVGKERIDLGGYERYRRSTGDPDDPAEEIESHHVMLGDQRVLLVDDVLTARAGGQGVAEQTLWRYQYGNHQGSVGLELDDAGRVISHEEFHPYGTPACRLMNAQAGAPAKRYRYTGMERDEESGLACHGARYYSASLGRWCSPDPSGLRDGPNRYCYCRCNPAGCHDRDGQASETSQSFGAGIEAAFAGVLKTLDRSFEEQTVYPGSRIDFTLDGKTVDLKGRRLGNWLLADGSLNVSAITAFELRNLEESVKHVNATKTSETMLYVLQDAQPHQVEAYHRLLKTIHSGDAAKALMAQLPKGTRVGLGVTTRATLTRVADVYFTGVFKRAAGQLSRIKKAGKTGLAIGVVAGLVALPALGATSPDAALPVDQDIEIASFDTLRATIKDEPDAQVVEAIIGNARNAMADAIRDEEQRVRDANVESGHFVQSNFNPVALLPVVGDYLDSSNIGSPVVELSFFVEEVQQGIKSRLGALKTRLEKIGTPLNAGEEQAMSDALYDAWGIGQPWRK